jgi:hypothetical protein
MQIVPPSRELPAPKALVGLKAVVFTAVGLVWALASIGAAAYDLSPQFHSWRTIRIVIWIIQFLLVVVAVCFWLFERPRQVKVEGLPEPPVIHSS